MLKGLTTGLRALERNDLSTLLDWRNQPEYRRFFREYRELGSDQQQGWYERIVLQDRNTEMFAVTELETMELIGACGLCYIDWVNRNADVSIYIGKDGIYADKTYAADAVRIMMKYGFEELGLHRLWTELYDFDEKKIDMFQSLGFVLEGRHRETHWSEGAWHDSLFFGRLADGK